MSKPYAPPYIITPNLVRLVEIIDGSAFFKELRIGGHAKRLAGARSDRVPDPGVGHLHNHQRSAGHLGHFSVSRTNGCPLGL